MTHRLEDKNRRNLNLDRSKVSEILPEYFQSEYNSSSDLTVLLKKYYNFLDSSGRHSFKTEINNIISARDAAQNDENYLDQLISEIGNGLTASSFFQNPRLMAKYLPLLYGSKGTKLSAEAFFKGFFGEEATISYPKNEMLYVGGKEPTGEQGRIGFNDQNFIQNNALYQIYSILVTVSLASDDYETLYKKFVHPAGFYLGTRVLTDENGIISFSGFTENPLDPNIGAFLVTDEASGIITTFQNTEITGLIESNGVNFRLKLNDIVDNYKDITITTLNYIYGTNKNLVTPNSLTFDITGVIGSENQSVYDSTFSLLPSLDSNEQWVSIGTSDSNRYYVTPFQVIYNDSETGRYIPPIETYEYISDSDAETEQFDSEVPFQVIYQNPDGIIYYTDSSRNRWVEDSAGATNIFDGYPFIEPTIFESGGADSYSIVDMTQFPIGRDYQESSDPSTIQQYSFHEGSYIEAVDSDTQGNLFTYGDRFLVYQQDSDKSPKLYRPHQLKDPSIGDFPRKRRYVIDTSFYGGLDLYGRANNGLGPNDENIFIDIRNPPFTGVYEARLYKGNKFAWSSIRDLIRGIKATGDTVTNGDGGIIAYLGMFLYFDTDPNDLYQLNRVQENIGTHGRRYRVNKYIRDSDALTPNDNYIEVDNNGTVDIYFNDSHIGTSNGYGLESNGVIYGGDQGLGSNDLFLGEDAIVYRADNLESSYSIQEFPGRERDSGGTDINTEPPELVGQRWSVTQMVIDSDTTRGSGTFFSHNVTNETATIYWDSNIVVNLTSIDSVGLVGKFWRANDNIVYRVDGFNQSLSNAVNTFKYYNLSKLILDSDAIDSANDTYMKINNSTNLATLNWRYEGKGEFVGVTIDSGDLWYSNIDNEIYRTDKLMYDSGNNSFWSVSKLILDSDGIIHDDTYFEATTTQTNLFYKDSFIGSITNLTSTSGSGTAIESNQIIWLGESSESYDNALFAYKVMVKQVDSGSSERWSVSKLQFTDEFFTGELNTDMSTTTETMDNDMFTRYLSDSSV